MNWTIILSYIGLLFFFKVLYMWLVGFIFLISNSITNQGKYLRISFSGFLIWVLVNYVWMWINESAMPLMAFALLLILFSIQFLAPNLREAKNHARSEILGLLMAAFYVFVFIEFNWY